MKARISVICALGLISICSARADSFEDARAGKNVIETKELAPVSFQNRPFLAASAAEQKKMPETETSRLSSERANSICRSIGFTEARSSRQETMNAFYSLRLDANVAPGVSYVATIDPASGSPVLSQADATKSFFVIDWTMVFSNVTCVRYEHAALERSLDPSSALSAFAINPPANAGVDADGLKKTVASGTTPSVPPSNESHGSLQSRAAD